MSTRSSLRIRRTTVRSNPRQNKAHLLALGVIFSLFSLRGEDYTVVNTNDTTAAGSLRWAIATANANQATAPHRILFNLPTNTTSISLTNGLVVAVPMLIDGSSQPNFAGQPVVELVGTSAGANNGLTLSGASSNIVVRSLVINRFVNDGITIQNAGGNRVEGCYLGTDRTGTNVLANGQYGILVSSSPRNVIGGTNASQRNVIAGFTAAGGLRPAIGLLNAGAAGNVIQGNYVGIGADGVTRVGRGYGVHLEGSPSNQIGGTVIGSGNVISGNDATGIFLHGTGANGNVVQGNIIGLNPAGTLTVSNGADGVTVEGGSGNVIGGTESGARNVISGNAWGGIHIKDLAGTRTGGSNNIVQGNYVGTDAIGRLARGNGSPGLTLTGVSGNQIGGTNTTWRNVIAGNVTSGLLVNTNSTGNWIQGNFIGVDATGTNALGNGSMGVGIDSAFGNTIGGSVAGAGNVISGNTNHGVFLIGTATTNNVIAGNFIGTDATGSKALKNMTNGIRLISSPRNWIGGPGTAARNIISGNGQEGMYVLVPANSNTIQGNFIGTDVTGTKGLGNGGAGLSLFGVSGTIIGGSAPGAGNIISASGFMGIYMGSAVDLDTVIKPCAFNVIQGNYIGTDLTGTAALGNVDPGVYLASGVSNTIGGSATGAGNLISGGNYWGLRFGSNTLWNKVQGNRVGTKADGVSALPNRAHGIDLENGSTNNMVGGTGANAGNIFAFAPSPYGGVRVRDGALNNAILGNSIFSNGALGIDLGSGGVSANDPCDGDGGANLLQNFPVLAEVQAGSNLWVRGSLNSAPNQTYLLQFFANQARDTSGNGEGQIYLGDVILALGAACSNSFTNTLSVVVPVGYWISATATDPANNTSEFALCVQATSQDTTPPTISCTANTNVFTDTGRSSKSNVTYSITATDDHTTVVLVCLPPSGSTFALGPTTVACVATDTRGNTNACSFTVTVLDKEAPTIVGCPGNVTVSNTIGQCSVAVTWTAPTATDNCALASFTSNHQPGGVFPLGVTTVTYTALDTNGNSNSCSFTVTIKDAVAPTIQWFQTSLLLTVTTNCQALLPNLTTTNFILAVDNCSSVTVTQSVAANTALGLGTNKVVLAAFDPAGNVAYCTNSVLVVDSAPPVLTCLGNISVNADAGQCSKSNVTFTATATDNCAVTNLACAPASGTTFVTGVTTVTCTATDSSSNTAQCIFTVTVLDTHPPTIAAPPDVVVMAAPGQCSSTNVGLGAPATSDNCGVAGVTNDAPPDFSLGETWVTWTATDVHGNSSSSTQKVTVAVGLLLILTQPQSATNVAGTDATFTVAVASCGGAQPAPVFQWYVSGTSTLAGATNATLTISNVQPAHAGDYTVVVGNTAGSITSLVARLTVELPSGTVTGRVELEAFVGARRVVTFLATDKRGVILKTWNRPLDFTFDGTNGGAAYSLPDVPLDAVSLSAKTAWSLRQRLSVNFSAGRATADFTGASRLLGGDLDGSNTCDASDFFILAANWFTVHLVADIDGNGKVDADDYFILANHWNSGGDTLEQPNTVSGLVELEYFVGAHCSVTFKATDGGGTILRTWNLPLDFAGGVALYTLPDVPLDTVGLSAKTEWTLRQKLPVVFANDRAMVDFLGDSALPGGDLDDSNTCDVFDYFILAGAWYTHDLAADIDGNGVVDLDDYFLLAFHWYSGGDPE